MNGYTDKRIPIGRRGLAARLRALQERTGVTNQQLAQGTGATLNTVSKWRSGVQGMKAEAAIAAARVLGCSPAELLEGATVEIAGGPVGTETKMRDVEDGELLALLQQAVRILKDRLPHDPASRIPRPSKKRRDRKNA